MSELFNKALDAISTDDINLLIEDGYPEGTLVEYKQELPSKNNRVDPWLEDNSNISEYARNQLLKEIVAFANGSGGYLIIGIVESDDKPARAISINPLPRCAELAEKFRLQVRDCISPKLPLIHTQGIVMEEDGAGLVVVYVPQSQIAPHRLEPTLHCYVRRNDRSEKMTMREIQDLTLQRSRFMEGIDEKFEERQAKFRRLVQSSYPESDCQGIRVSMIPISSEIWVNRVHKNESLQPIQEVFVARLETSKVRLDSLHHFQTWQNRPLLRGSRHSSEKTNHFTIQEIYCDGTIDYLFINLIREDKEDQIYPEWIFSFVANALLMADLFRRYAGYPNIEYGLEVEIMRTANTLKLNQYPPGRQAFIVEENPLVLPRISFGASEDFPEVMKIIHRDIWDSAGADIYPNFDVKIPKELTHLENDF